jgi:uncharacterized protein (DUF58 family)
MDALPDPLTLPGVDLDPDHLFRLRHLPSRTRLSASTRLAPTPGQTVSRRRGHGIETDDIRAWVPGDDIRHVDRNATARTGTPHVRTFRDERQRALLLLADFRPSMLFGTRRVFRSVAAAEALAIAGWRAADDGGRIGLLAVGPGEPVLVRMAQGDRAMSAVVAGMARAHGRALESADAAEPPLDDFLDLAARCLPRGGTVILASAVEHPGEGFERTARALCLRGGLCVILISDAFEREPPPGRYPFLSGEGTRGEGTVARKTGPSRDLRLAKLHDLGAPAVRLDAEIEPEDNASLLIGLDRLGL